MPTIDLRTDSNGYVEGTQTASMALVRGILAETFLRPGITYTQHLLSDAGDVEIPVITGETNGGVTDVCAVGTAGSASFDYEALKIDKKATGKFDGCFTVAGLADKMVERALNSAKVQIMKNDYERYVFTEIENNLTDSVTPYVSGTTDPVKYLNDLKVEYRRLTKYTAKIAFCKLEFYNDLVNSRVNLGSPMGDEVFVVGSDMSSRVAGLLLVPVDYLTRDVVIYNPAGLNIGFPTNTKAIGGGVLGDMTGANMDFAGGLVSVQFGGQDGSLNVGTWLHMPFGVTINDSSWFLASPATV